MAEKTKKELQNEEIAQAHLARQRQAAGVLISGKAGEILQHLYPDEPVFVFRAKDVLSVFALEAYAELIEKYDGQGEQAGSLSDAIWKFREWQRANPDKVKLPD